MKTITKSVVIVALSILLCSCQQPKPNFNPISTNNDFAEFYASRFLASSLQECYKNAPEYFLQQGEPELISPRQLDLLNSPLVVIGVSAFSSNFYSKKGDALDLGKELKAKFIIYEAKAIDEYGVVNGQQVQRKEMEATYAIAVNPEEFAQKCPRLFQEWKMQIESQN